jgi:serine/threonine-protein kinase
MAVKCPKCGTENPSDSKYCKECSTPLPLSKDIPAQTKTIVTPIPKLTRGITFAGRYEIIEELGRGGMGVVYKAHDTKLKRTVALKFLPPELTYISEIKERFMREAQAAAALDHPNICTVYEFDEADEKTFISMAYIEGQSLKKKIESGPLDLDESLNLAIQAAEGLQEAHKKGVVHRDIKSANIMVDKRDQAKIMDFGLARVTGGTLVTKEGTTMGTIAYMSPEQARGEKVDYRTDIWSLGVVLYEMISGQLPFKGEHDQSIMYSILNEEPGPITHLNSDIPTAIEQIVGKALEKTPDERYQHIEELLEDLRSISEGIEPEGIRARLRKAKLLRRKKAFLYAGIAGFIVIMTVIALSLFTGRVEAMDSIAVLPLENFSGDPDQEYLSDGITDALINELAKISALRVISRHSVMLYKGSEKPLSEIARELGVDAVVEASVQTVGGRVQIRAQLIQMPAEKNLWADSYEREMSDILALQSDVVRAIVKEIKIAVTPEEETLLASTREVNPETYELYLKGMYHLNKYTPEGIEKGLAYLYEAVEKDPEEPLAYAGLAIGFGIIAHTSSPPPYATIRSREAALKALELDENLAEVHLALAMIKIYTDWDRIGAEQAYQRALELNPNLALAHGHYAFLILINGHEDEALAESNRAQELDPLAPIYPAWHGWMYFWVERYDEAIEQALKSLELVPDFPVGLYVLGCAYAAKGMYEKAIAAHQKAAGISPDFKWGLGQTYALAGRKDEALGVAAELESQPKVWDTLGLAEIYTALGEKDEAFRWLEAAYQQRHPYIQWLRRDGSFDSLRDDPRYNDLAQRMNLPD